MTDHEVIDIQGEEMHDEPVPQTSTAVVRRERRSEVIRPLDASELTDSFRAYQQLLPQLLDDSDYQDAGRGKRFVKKSGWRKIATAFDLDVQIVRSVVDRDDQGQPLRAEVWARAIAPSGRSMDGDGYCSIDEERFSGPRGNKSKVENDLRATATTRAMNRAISGLVGMGEVSAEEVSAGYGHAVAPAWAEQASDELVTTLRNAVAFLLDEPADGPAVTEIVGRIAQDTDGQVIAAPARAVLYAAAGVKAKRETTA